MGVLFTLAFLAAIVGVFKPYINGVKRWQFGLAALVALILVGVTGDKQTSGSPDDNGTETVAAMPEETMDPNAPATNEASASEPGSKWEYSEEKDEMRGGAVTRFANLSGENTLNLGFPYGDQQGKLLVRQSPKFGFDILVGVDSGQILCHSYSNAHINVKFDDGPIKRYGCTDASDGTSNMVFVEGAKGFLNEMKKSKKMIVEAEFYQAGMQQMTFDTANLKWGN